MKGACELHSGFSHFVVWLADPSMIEQTTLLLVENVSLLCGVAHGLKQSPPTSIRLGEVVGELSLNTAFDQCPSFVASCNLGRKVTANLISLYPVKSWMLSFLK